MNLSGIETCFSVLAGLFWNSPIQQAPLLHSHNNILLPSMDRISLPVFYSGHSIFEQGHQTIEIFLGDPPQKFNALLDIGWPDTIVPSILCKDDDFCEEAANLYDETKSSTGVQLHEDIEHSRDDLLLKGLKMEETITIGGLTVRNQAFSSVYAVRDLGFGGGGYHAILGLTPNPSPSVSNPYDPRLEKPSAFQTMIIRGMLKRNMFGFKPARGSETPGVLHLGWFDPSYSEKLVNIPLGRLPAENPWHVSVPTISIGEDEKKLENYYAYFSTTTSFLQLPAEIVTALEHALDTEAGDQIDCAKRVTGPPLTFSFGPERERFTISPSQYINEDCYDGESYCWPAFASADNEDNGPGGTKQIVLGTKFMEAFYSIFNTDSKIISFALV